MEWKGASDDPTFLDSFLRRAFVAVAVVVAVVVAVMLVATVLATPVADWGLVHRSPHHFTKQRLIMHNQNSHMFVNMHAAASVDDSRCSSGGSTMAGLGGVCLGLKIA